MASAPEVKVASPSDGTVRGAASQPNATLLLWAQPQDPVYCQMYYKGVEPRDLRVWISRRLGSGGFGVVLEGEIVATEKSQSQLVAVKRFNPVPSQDTFYRIEFTRWNGLDHPHILPFFGVCNLGVGQCGLVSPLCRKGHMNKFIANFPDTNRLQLVKQVADAIYYLHCVTAGIIHGDLKCENVLISDDDSALLCDQLVRGKSASRFSSFWGRIG